jgi:hypothetical protein
MIISGRNFLALIALKKRRVYQRNQALEVSPRVRAAFFALRFSAMAAKA